MDLEFNIIGFGYTKTCSGINLLHFGTTLVYWASFYHQILTHFTVYGVEAKAGHVEELVRLVWLFIYFLFFFNLVLFFTSFLVEIQSISEAGLGNERSPC